MLVKTKYFLLFFLIIVSCDKTTKEEYYVDASKLEDQMRYKEAILLHNKILNEAPKFRPSLINRGADKSALGNYNGAIVDYKKILKFDSDNLLAMMNIGNNYENLKDFNSAIGYYTMAMNSKQVIKTGKFQIQIKYNDDFDKDYEYQINDYEILFERGTAYLLNEQYEKAILDLSQLIKTGEMVGDAHFYLGESYFRMKDTINACINYKISAEKGISIGKKKTITYCN